MSDPMLPSGSNRCKCQKCGLYFSTVSAFDKHLRIEKDGRTTHRDPEKIGLVLSDDGYWQWPASEVPRFAKGESRHAPEQLVLVS